MSWRLIVLIALAVVLAASAAVFKLMVEPPLRAIAGFVAKTSCSEVFVADRSLQDVRASDLGGLHPAIDGAGVSAEDGVATARVAYLVARRAYHRPGVGCALADRRADLPEVRLSGAPAATHAWPEARRGDPAARADVDYDALDAAIEHMFFDPDQDGLDVGTRAVLVVHGGDLIAERYAAGFPPERRHTGWSMSKTVTAALAGVLVKEGALSLDDKPAFAGWPADDPRTEIDLAHLMAMTSGLDFREAYGESLSDVVVMLYAKDDMAGFAADKLLAHAPGDLFYYSSGTTNMISKMLMEAGGFDAASYAEFPHAALFRPLGMASPVFETDASGVLVGSSFVYATARDWARFGQFLLRDGVWAGERLLPEGWVDYMRTPIDPPKGGAGGWGYGAQTWLNAGADTESGLVWPDLPADIFMASGHDGQAIAVIPSRDVVIVRLGFTRDWDAERQLGRLIRETLTALPEPADAE
ncbi:MAG: serine hydrolase [Pseudomonadota bacterium]